MSAKVKIFIGSGEQSLLERKVLLYSLYKHSRSDLEIAVFNGTHNSIERTGSPPVPAPLSLQLKYRNLTEFSLYRYLIPELCSYEGRAIYLDSDMVCLADIQELFDALLDGHDFLAKREAYSQNGESMWGLSAMLIDNSRCRFDLQQFLCEIDDGLYTYTEFSQFGAKFLARHSYRLGEIDPNWNVFDQYDGQTKLIHYTNLMSQPWKFPDHPFGELWFKYFFEARKSGWISDWDIDLTIARGYARSDLLKGNSSIRKRSFFRKWFGSHL